MTHAIVFSRNRPAQLDLLLSSISRYAPNLAEQITVLWRADNNNYKRGYLICGREHPNIGFLQETAFNKDLRKLVFNYSEQYEPLPDHYVFFCDDDVFYRPLPTPTPQTLLGLYPNVLTVSLRLGFNTQRCYSLRINQGLPTTPHHWEDGFLWEWKGQTGDWGYPGSLDGNVWRAVELEDLLNEQQPANPNQLEEMLNRACERLPKMEMICYRQSCLVGNAVNLVNDSHATNRYGETHNFPVELLNDWYLDDMRIKNTISPSHVNAAHTEQPFILYVKGDPEPVG